MGSVSICIPTYNGAQMLAQTLESILGQIRPDVEIVICDDCSTDRTVSIAQEYAGKYSNIRVFQNKINLGMDRNFIQSASHAQNEFVWFSGQDDIFEPGTIVKFFDIIDKSPQTNFIYFNYRFVSGDLSKDIAPPPISFAEDRFFKSAEEYFGVLDHAPSFLPATILRTSFLKDPDLEAFFGTHYVQVGAWLKNFHLGNAYVVAEPGYILCRVPEDSWKKNGGQMLFEIFSGSLEVYQRCADYPNSVVPEGLLAEKRREYLSQFFLRTLRHKCLGFEFKPFLRKRLFYLFGRQKLTYFCYILPVAYIPRQVAVLIMWLYRFPILTRFFSFLNGQLKNQFRNAQ